MKSDIYDKQGGCAGFDGTCSMGPILEKIQQHIADKLHAYNTELTADQLFMLMFDLDHPDPVLKASILLRICPWKI